MSWFFISVNSCVLSAMPATKLMSMRLFFAAFLGYHNVIVVDYLLYVLLARYSFHCHFQGIPYSKVYLDVFAAGKHTKNILVGAELPDLSKILGYPLCYNTLFNCSRKYSFYSLSHTSHVLFK